MTLQSLSLERDQSDSLTLHSWSFAIDSLYLDSLSLQEDRYHSLNWISLSLQNSNSQSLILHSLHDTRDRFCSLTLPSLSLIEENCFPRLSLEETSFEHGILEELDENLVHTKLEKKAGTNSFPSDSFTKTTLAQEAGTNSFFKSFSYRIWSLRMCLRMLLFCSFQFISAALILGTCFCTSSFSKESLPEAQLVAAYLTDSLHCAALRDTTKHSLQLQPRSVQSFQLPKQQLNRGFVQGGAALQQRASSTTWHCAASALTSLSLALGSNLQTRERAEEGLRIQLRP